MQDPLGTMAGMKTIPQDYGKFIIKTATGGVSFGTNATGETSDMMQQKIVGQTEVTVEVDLYNEL